jgi:predicted NAD/FAD-binding protein
MDVPRSARSSELGRRAAQGLIAWAWQQARDAAELDANDGRQRALDDVVVAPHIVDAAVEYLQGRQTGADGA